MFNIYRMVFLALKTVYTVKITPWQIFTTRWKSHLLYQLFPFPLWGIFPPTSLMLFGKLLHFYLSITRWRKNFYTFLQFHCELGFSLTLPKIKCPWRFFIHTWKYWIWISKNESILSTTAWKSADYSSIQNCVWACHLVSVRKIPTSLMDKCKRMT